MLFTAPIVLAAFAALPVLWWLLRVTPPAPRREAFPAVRLLLGLTAPEETPARTPWWLLALRLLAAALVILGLAGPVLHPGAALPGKGPVLLAIDNGWAAAADWAARTRAAAAVLDRAARAGRGVALLATAADGEGAPPRVSPVLPAAVQRTRLAALRPEPWPSDRSADAAALAALGARCGSGDGTAPAAPGAVEAGPKDQAGCPGTVVYLADGLTDGPGFDRFARALAALGPVRDLRAAVAPQLLLPPENRGDALLVRVAQPPRPVPAEVRVLASTAAGQPLAQTTVRIPPGAAVGTAPLRLPPELRNRVSRLVLPGVASAGAVVLLDERWRRRPVGLASADPAAANAPFLGTLYYVSRALGPYAELREGGLDALLHDPLSALVLADDPLPPGPQRNALAAWVRAGGELIRFAGPRTAAAPPAQADPLLPVQLLSGDRALGGTMSWGRPEHLAPFPPELPLRRPARAGRRDGAQPGAGPALGRGAGADLGGAGRRHPAGHRGGVRARADRAVPCHRQRRMVEPAAVRPVRVHAAPAGGAVGRGEDPARPRGAGAVADPGRDGHRRRPAAGGDRAGGGPGRRHRRFPAPSAGDLRAGRRAAGAQSGHEPGFAGGAPAVPGAVASGFDGLAAGFALGPPLVALAAALLVVDLLLSFGLRGVLRLGGRGTGTGGGGAAPPRAGRRGRRAGTAAGAVLLGLGLLAGGPARADGTLARVANPALGARLGYIVTGAAQVDLVSREGLEGLSDFVNTHTAATLDAPDPVVPGQTDLSFYPLLYWPIAPDAPALSAAAAQALDRFMRRGGILVIDTGAAAAGGTPAPGAVAALSRAAGGLAIPPLTPLSIQHVLARSFYLLRTYPGRYAGGAVWVARRADRGGDDVSPVVIGANDWAAAWAVGPNGQTPYATIPGGEDQRTLAYRFGVNLVMYALTGSYKGDQLQMKAILQRLGQ